MSECSEAEKDLVDRVRRDDQDAFRQLIERYERQAIALAIMITIRHDAARDAVANATVEYWKKRATDVAPHSCFWPLYGKMIWDRACDEWRRQARSPSLERHVENGGEPADWSNGNRLVFASTPPSPEEYAVQRENRTEVLDCVNRLRPEFRVVLYMKYWLGKTRDEIAGEIGYPAGTIGGWTERAKAMVRQCMEVRQEAGYGRTGATAHR